MEALVEADFPGHRIMPIHQRPGIVEQKLLDNPAKMPEGRLDPRQPGRLALMGKRHHKAPPAVTQGRHKQMHPHLLPGNHHHTLTKVDLHLFAGRRLEPHRRPALRFQAPAKTCHSPLHRPQGNLNPMHPLQLLAHHLGIAAMTAELLLHKGLQPLQLAGSFGLGRWFPTPLAYITPDRVAAHAKFFGYPPAPPSLGM
ncbi:hypothetical protein MIT9_P0706 [Methylomarinovum caldicuralii]|uniref:Uncharacterized protein n=1 Tax=Methylomarinovum caldicuralii TaxID=438856 RepID=A0AAU9CML7_9GAMM|nr:hypothetical protein [Methylomarinovum caldicuralii]BCX81128.1 hypothetical protein MIT9_P0706 [Methylomarinovum caldicuralii]